MKGKTNLILLVLIGIFLLIYFVPFSSTRVSAAIGEAFLLLSEYAREHALLCLVPALFIAGAISVFLNQQSVIRYLGPRARMLVAYSVASVSGAILAVCSCTVLPLFKGIYKKGAGIGPAINILAIVLTAKVLGLKIGIARAGGAVLLAVVIGLLMHLIFKKDDAKRVTDISRFFPCSSGVS